MNIKECIITACAVLSFTSCTSIDKSVMAKKVDPRGTRYSEKETLHLGEIHLKTNEWTDKEQKTSIFLDEDGTFGIEWERGDTGPADKPYSPNYPKAELGANPWNKAGHPIKSTSTLLPIQLKDLESASMTVDVTTTTKINKGWNLAFELWLTDQDPTQGPAVPKAEVMIFLGNNPGYWPSKDNKDKYNGSIFNDGHNTYTLYHSEDDWNDWDHYRQWRIGDTDGIADFKGTVDIYAFLKHHIEKEGWDKNLWLTRFEIGNETYRESAGITRFKSLSFEINGETRKAITE